MEYKQLRDEVFSLDDGHKRMLFDDLARSYARDVRIGEEERKCRELLDKYTKVMLETLGNEFDEKILFSHSRIHPLPYARMIISKYLRDQGFSLNVIGRSMGFNHSTVSFHVDEVLIVLENPRRNPELASIEKRFRYALEKRS